MPTAARIFSLMSRWRSVSLDEMPANTPSESHRRPAAEHVLDDPGNTTVQDTQPWKLSNMEAEYGFSGFQTSYEPTIFEDQCQDPIDPNMMVDVSDGQQDGLP
ncbi:hypothetical protein J3458_008887 [Metarhizium acridum]|uniref:uncharacterized protein n=1 Tax=Metarhizium acridum TaxID=92637 RepID=UPI001C6CD2FF|nr:hypothetical protein J3458_008887 [Metarhizium acridum]